MPEPTDLNRVAESTLPGDINPPPLWVSMAWGISPAVLVTMFAYVFGPRWPYLTWVLFLGGVTNLYVFSAYHLIARKNSEWIVKAALLTGAMLVLNLVLAAAAGFALGILPATTPAAP